MGERSNDPRLRGDTLPPYDELVARLERIEQRKLTLADLPMTPLQTKLENDWQPNPGVLLPPAGITETLLADGSVTFDKIAAPVTYAEVLGTSTRLNVAYGALAATTGPTLTVTDAGVYVIEHGCYLRSDTIGAAVFQGLSFNGSVPVDSESVREDTNTVSRGGHRARAVQKTLAVGDVINCLYRSSAGTGLFAERWLKLTRIG